MKTYPALSILVLCAISIQLAVPASGPADADWPAYGGVSEGTRYSSLKQINRTNVKRLQPAWTFDPGDGAGASQTQPIVVDGVLYGITPKHKVVAVDAATGKLLWTFDSGVPARGPNRGVAYWAAGNDRRIFVGVLSYLYAIDARTGKAIRSFGMDGRIDLREGLGRDSRRVSLILTTPGIVYKDLLIVGGRTPEQLPAAPGDVRAFDVRTGKVRWSFHTIPRPGEFGYDTWPKDAWTYTGSANNWPGMALDEKRGIVYVPTGSAANDFYGADRAGDNLFANTLLALDAETGKRVWHFQAVKHDIWDRDFPSPPTLVAVKRDGKTIPAVAQTTKQGWLYLFDRYSGEPLFPIEYGRYPRSRVLGEAPAEMQPLPIKPAPFARQLLTESMLTNRSPEAHQWAVEQFRKMRSEGQFVPFSVGQETILFPGYDGGAEWGGSAYDPDTGILYVNSNDIAWTGALAETEAPVSPRELYLSRCSGCHGESMGGAPPATPALADLGTKRTEQEVATIIREGSGRMPSFRNLRTQDLAALAAFLINGDNRGIAPPPPDMSVPRYRFTGYKKFLDPDGYPAVAPPWGTLNAVNLNTGEYAWKIPLGEYPELAATGMKSTGTENYGGPIVTAGGLLFIAATNFDRKFRAFDKDSGELLWETTLPFAGNATPITYEAGGRQYVVIYATGGKGKTTDPTGGVYVAFALPRGR